MHSTLERADPRAVARDLGEVGVVVAPWLALGLPGVEDVQPALTGLAVALTARPGRDTRSDSAIRLGHREVLEDVRVFQWGLQDAVLDLVEDHLGAPCHYLGPVVHRELAGSRLVGSRHWHRDVEDHRVLRLRVHLDDVGPDDGPFTWVPRGASSGAARSLRYTGGPVGDDRFAELVPRPGWHRATGPRWTAVVADTAQVFHRALPPVSHDRVWVTWTWTTRTGATFPGEHWRPDHARRAVGDLGARQRACLPPVMGLGPRG